MDINELKTRDAHNEGAEMRVKGPDGKLTDFYIILAGCDSELWESIVREAQKGALKGDKIDAKDTVAKSTLGWRGLTSNGKEVPFSHDAVLDLYRNAPYIFNQADEFIATRGNFLKPKSIN